MIFITGPLFSGKRTFAKALFDWSDGELLEHAVLDAQDLVKNEENLDALADRLAEASSRSIRKSGQTGRRPGGSPASLRRGRRLW